MQPEKTVFLRLYVGGAAKQQVLIDGYSDEDTIVSEVVKVIGQPLEKVVLTFGGSGLNTEDRPGVVFSKGDIRRILALCSGKPVSMPQHYNASPDGSDSFIVDVRATPIASVTPSSFDHDLPTGASAPAAKQQKAKPNKDGAHREHTAHQKAVMAAHRECSLLDCPPDIAATARALAKGAEPGSAAEWDKIASSTSCILESAARSPAAAPGLALLYDQGRSAGYVRAQDLLRQSGEKLTWEEYKKMFNK
jgi:hypothetical protein